MKHLIHTYAQRALPLALLLTLLPTMAQAQVFQSTKGGFLDFLEILMGAALLGAVLVPITYILLHIVIIARLLFSKEKPIISIALGSICALSDGVALFLLDEGLPVALILFFVTCLLSGLIWYRLTKGDKKTPNDAPNDAPSDDAPRDTPDELPDDRTDDLPSEDPDDVQLHTNNTPAPTP